MNDWSTEMSRARRTYSDVELRAFRVVERNEWKSGDPATRGPAQYATGDWWPNELLRLAESLRARADAYLTASAALRREVARASGSREDDRQWTTSSLTSAPSVAADTTSTTSPSGDRASSTASRSTAPEDVSTAHASGAPSLTEKERRRILLAFRDSVLEPGQAVLIEVERILAARLAPPHDGPPCAVCGTDDETCIRLCAAGGHGCCSACWGSGGCSHSAPVEPEGAR